MKREFIVICAFALDLLIGDPRSYPHPVRFIGRAARRWEKYFRLKISSPFWAGVVTSSAVYGASFFIPAFLMTAGHKLGPWVGDVLSVFIVYSTIALRDLLHHSSAVYGALKASSLDSARAKVSMIVGRDTQKLSEKEVVRACVESVSESLVDGITAPLFFAIFLGPAWAMLYRAVNTLDSLFGHKDEVYHRFGTFPARVDDLANYLPARLTAPLVIISSLLLRLHPLNALRILKRDGRKHPSPNSGLAEAAFAGALGVQLGGANYYEGEVSLKPCLGEEREPLGQVHILLANALVLTTSVLVLLLYLAIYRQMMGWIFSP